jgi:hypothetical protein
MSLYKPPLAYGQFPERKTSVVTLPTAEVWARKYYDARGGMTFEGDRKREPEPASERWTRALENAAAGKLDPVEMIRHGDDVVVHDGNHRAAACHELGIPTMKVEVDDRALAALEAQGLV